MGNDKKKKKKDPKAANVYEFDHRKERHHLAQGTGTDSAAAPGPGCISPTGCLLGEEISINEVIDVRVGGDGGAANAVANTQDKYVKVLCTNQEKCKLVPFMRNVTRKYNTHCGRRPTAERTCIVVENDRAADF